MTAQRHADGCRGRLDVKPEPTEPLQRWCDLVFRHSDDPAARATQRRQHLGGTDRLHRSDAIGHCRLRREVLIPIPYGREGGTVRRLHREKARQSRYLALSYQFVKAALQA
jgi:hypothetical protein